MLSKEYLENGICVLQDDELYKFTSDAILLSNFVVVKKGDVVADFCAGSGIVGLNTYAKHKDKIKSVTFFEMQKEFCALIENSLKENGLEQNFNAVCVKVQDIGKEYFGKFSLITCNPPYFKTGSGFGKENPKLKMAREEVYLPLEDLIFKISKCLKFGGRVCMVHLADRLVDVLYLMRKYNLEPKRLQFYSAKDKAPYLFTVEATLGGKSGLKILKQGTN